MIYDVDKVDIMAKGKDGSLDLFIISSGAIDASPNTQKVLLDKISNYLAYASGDDFSIEFPDVKKEDVSIILEFDEPAPQLLLDLCEKITLWVENNGIRFVVRDIA